MRLLVSVLALLIVVATVGWLATRQLAVVVPVSARPDGAGAAASAPALPAAPQARQLQQDYKQAIEDAMRQPRPTGDEVK